MMIAILLLLCLNLGMLFKLDRRMRRMGLSQDDAIVRLDALTTRSQKILTEVQAVKQALIDLRNAQGDAPLKPEAEAALVRAETAVGNIDDVNDDADPTGAGAAVQPA